MVGILILVVVMNCGSRRGERNIYEGRVIQVLAHFSFPITHHY